MQSNFQTQASSNNSNHIQQLRDCLNNLCERSFWQYASFYGVSAQNCQSKRENALEILLNSHRMNDKLAKKTLRHLGISPMKQAG
jgi:hypothetical protein